MYKFKEIKSPSVITLDPKLIGWFAVAISSELKPGQQKEGLLAGKQYILYRSLTGNLTFNGTTKEIVEQNNIIFVWHHPKESAPLWHIPILDETGWSLYRYHQLQVCSHPQEVYENSTDVAHFSVVHGFNGLSVIQEPCFEGHIMSVKHRIERKNRTIFGTKSVTANFEVRLHGIGCAHTHINVPSLGIQVRMLTLTTPTQTGLVNIRLAVSIAMNGRSYLKRIFTPFIHRSIQKSIVNDFCQDVTIWEHKCYRAIPLLVKGDGKIMKFRSWCSQFYA